ncbi:MAG: SPFH domain-containing protein [Phycisphaerae bacterium]
MKLRIVLVSLIGVAFLAAGASLAIAWTFFRVYVPPDHCLVLVRKSGAPMPAGQKIATAGEKGIQENTLGPGRYFLNPVKWETELEPLVTIEAGDPNTWQSHYVAGRGDHFDAKLDGKWPEVGIVTSLAGKVWDQESEVVEKGYQGKWREVLSPGTYRINPRAYKVEKVPAVVVPVGYCGVVTSQLGNMPGVETVMQSSIGPDGKVVQGRPSAIQKLAEPGQRGVLRNVLPPGIYYLNPYVHKVKIVEVGYNLISQLRTDQETEHIEFPSQDGFTVEVEVTVVWGRDPRHTPELINRLGDIEKIRDLVIAQIRSICRNIGSDYISTDFIEGEKREQYQQQVTETLKKVCRERNLEVLIALIHNIEVRADSASKQEDLKLTIQSGFIAREQDLLRQEQSETAKVLAELEAAEAAVPVAREEVASDMRIRVAELQAEGRKKAEEIDAQRDLDVATIEREIAEIEAETERVLGRAQAEVEQMINQAEADGKRMFIDAFGSGSAYNLYTFAREFSPESIRLIFAGEGTFWTDLTKLQDAASMELLRKAGNVGGE